MTVRTRYLSNYDAIARAHLQYWRAYGENPFQDAKDVQAHQDATVAIAEKYLEPEDRLLDAGCGMGDLLLRLPGVGVDISADYLEVARERGLEVYQYEIEKMPWRDEFDMVLCTDVLEHVLDLNAAMRRLLRALRKGGVLIVRVPNDAPLAVDTAPYEFVHLRRFDAPALEILFGKVFELDVLEITPAGGIIHAVGRKC